MSKRATIRTIWREEKKREPQTVGRVQIPKFEAPEKRFEPPIDIAGKLHEKAKARRLYEG